MSRDLGPPSRRQPRSPAPRALDRRGRLRPGVGARVAADGIWTLESEPTYLALVRDRGWSADDYEAWLPGQPAAALLP